MFPDAKFAKAAADTLLGILHVKSSLIWIALLDNSSILQMMMNDDDAGKLSRR